MNRKRRALYESASAELEAHAARYAAAVHNRWADTINDAATRESEAYQDFVAGALRRAGYFNPRNYGFADWIWLAVAGLQLLLKIWELWKDKKDTRAAL